jgi:hypothetical protein
MPGGRGSCRAAATGGFRQNERLQESVAIAVIHVLNHFEVTSPRIPAARGSTRPSGDLIPHYGAPAREPLITARSGNSRLPGPGLRQPVTRHRRLPPRSHRAKMRHRRRQLGPVIKGCGSGHFSRHDLPPAPFSEVSRGGSIASRSTIPPLVRGLAMGSRTQSMDAACVTQGTL